MAITRVWLGNRLGITRLPPQVRNADRYNGDGHYLDSAQLSHNRRWLKLVFESGQTDYWCRSAASEDDWQYSVKSPTPDQLKDGVGLGDEPKIVE